MALASCSLGGSDTKPSAAPSSSSAPTQESSPTPTPTSAGALESARKLASQYDYEKALAALANDTSSEAAAEAEKIKATQASLVQWKDNAQVSHIFYHSLVIDAKRAFAKSNPQAKGYAAYMVTAKEFKIQLEQLLAKGYVLILPRHLMAKSGQDMKPVPLKLPPGKQPLILSIDDVSYYEYMNNHGFATKLVLDESGKVTNTYTDAQGKESKGAYDVSTVLDEFVEKHPEFSYRGDKGIFALTGYNGIFGYRTSEKTYGPGEKTKAAQEEAKKVALALKATGWEFASHSWGHIDMTKSSLAEIAADSQLWDTEVRPLLGEVDQIIFAFGADISDVTPYSMSNPKFAELNKKRKFDYIFPIDASAEHWGQVSAGTWRNARINIDGISMNRALRNKNDILNRILDVKACIDPERPKSSE